MTEWIFPNPMKPEHPTRPSAAYERTKVLLKQAGLPELRFHDLRHTFAAHALASGVDVKTPIRHPGIYTDCFHPGHLYPHHWRYAEAGG